MRATYADIHDLLDRLTPDQAEAIRVVIRQFPSPGQPDREGTDAAARRLSFIGLIPDGPRDLAERSEEIIRSRFSPA